MAENNIPNKTNSSDEIDLGQLFQMIGNGLNRIFKAFLGLFIYLKKNVPILIGLAIIGVLMGLGLNTLVDKKLKTEVIVMPNLESKNYLYDVVAEIQANIEAKDEIFFNNIGIEIENIDDFEITVEPVSGDKKGNLETEMKYLELLQNFENTGAISDIVRAEILDRSSLDQRITFFYKNAKLGNENALKLMDYINSNSYYNEIVKIYANNAQNRIKENDSLVKQIDRLIENYSKKMLMEDLTAQGRLVLDNEQQLNIPELFSLKNELIRDTESKKLELEKRKEALTIINFGKTQQMIKPLFQKEIMLFPSTLIATFFFFSFLSYLNRKALEMHL